jgi:hypothetical protein
VAVKKKSAAKKAAPKKSTAKKSAAKKSPAKKSAAKKSAPKRAVKKAVVKKKTAKKVAKKSTAKKSTAKKTVKKSTARKKIASQVVIPPVPSVGGSRVNVSTTPSPAAPRTSAASAKPTAASKPATGGSSKSSSKVLFAVLLGILLVGAIVITNSNKDSDDMAPEAPAVTESAAPEVTESAAPEETPAVTEPANTTGEAPSRFIGNWKDSSKSVMVITWKAPAGEVKGYSVETRANLGEWKVVSEVSATTTAAEFAKTATEGSTSFRVSAVYPDGSLGVATPFGFAGQFE